MRRAIWGILALVGAGGAWAQQPAARPQAPGAVEARQPGAVPPGQPSAPGEERAEGEVSQAPEPQGPVPRTLEGLQREVLELRQQVRGLQRQLETVRQEQAVIGAAARASAERGDTRRGITLITVTFEGKVRAVTPGRIEVLDESDNVYELLIDENTRVLRKGEPISPQQLTEGTPVRASFAHTSTGEDRAQDIITLEEPPQGQTSWELPQKQTRPPQRRKL